MNWGSLGTNASRLNQTIGTNIERGARLYSQASPAPTGRKMPQGEIS